MRFLILIVTWVVLSSTAMAQSFKSAAEYNRKMDGVSLLIMKDGVVIHESYPNLGGPNRAWHLASGTKSFSGTIAALAATEGMLDYDEPVSATILEWQGDAREDITIRELLTLISGIETPEPLANIGMTYAEAVAKPAIAEPGEQFAYGPTPFQVFGELMRRKLAAVHGDMYPDAVSYLQARIFMPLGIVPSDWTRDNGLPRMASGAYLTARDWATFGEFIRRGGVLNERKVIAPPLFTRMIDGTQTNPGYGMTWWLLEEIPEDLASGGGPQINSTDLYTNPRARLLPQDMFVAAGAGKQRLYIIPSEGLVIVRQQRILPGALRMRRKGMMEVTEEFSDVRLLELVLRETSPADGENRPMPAPLEPPRRMPSRK